MSTDRNTEYLVGLVRELCKLPRETEWVELKVNNSDPRQMGSARPGRTGGGCLMAGPLGVDERMGPIVKAFGFNGLWRFSGGASVN